MPVLDDDILLRLAERLGVALTRKAWVVATAESCTGGWLSKCMTDVVGSSAWFDRGFVTYSNAAKQELLGVKRVTLQGQGAVSSAVVVEMAAGALARSDADLAIALSGIAGPGGATLDKPVGLVWIAWQQRGHEAVTRSFVFPGGRDAVRRQAVAAAFESLLALCDGAA